MPISGELIAGALAGLAFVGCSLSTGSAPQPQGRRREVVVNGKRVKTVDIHAHTIVPEAAAVINHPLEAPGLLWSNLSDRIAEMDARGDRYRGAQHQPLLVSRGARRGGRADQDPE